MKNTYFYSKIFILIILSLFAMVRYANGVEFYEIEDPHRKLLGNKYRYDADVDDFEGRSPDIIDLKYSYIKKNNYLYNEQESVRKKLALYASEEGKSSKRQRFKQQQKQNSDNDNSDVKIEEKKISKSWIDDWLPDVSTKPMEMVGEYTAFRFWFASPMFANVNARETNANGTMDLFSGKAKYHIMPAFSVAFGNDRFKFWRYELELGYIPLLSSGISNFSQSGDASGLDISVTKKDLSMHLMTLAFNNFIQHEFFDKKLVGFAGLGLGVGHAWSMGAKLSSDFVMPIVTGHLGISFMIGNKSKINISYTMLYSQMSIGNKYSFAKDGHAIKGGSLKFSRLLINGFSVEYLFYTA